MATTYIVVGAVAVIAVIAVGYYLYSKRR